MRVYVPVSFSRLPAKMELRENRKRGRHRKQGALVLLLQKQQSLMVTLGRQKQVVMSCEPGDMHTILKCNYGNGLHEKVEIFLLFCQLTEKTAVALKRRYGLFFYQKTLAL